MNISDFSRRSLLMLGTSILASCGGGSSSGSSTGSTVSSSGSKSSNPLDFDIIIYGSSLGGLMALTRAAYRRGKRVCIIEPYSNYGGMHAAGLSFVDTSTNSNHETEILGGDTSNIYLNQIVLIDGSASNKYTFEPKTAEAVAKSLISSYAASAYSSSPIDVAKDVITETTALGPRIKGIVTSAGFLTGKVFIDASYEGDLMAAALGPSGYIIGRESATTYAETHGGYVSPNVQYLIGSAFKYYTGAGSLPPLGYPLLPDPVENIGQSDTRVQAYNFRLPLTRSSANRLPFIKPANYDNKLYTTYLQFLRTANGGKGYTRFCRDYNLNSLGFQANLSGSKVNWNAADLVNGNVSYPDGNWTTRNSIVDAHVLWQQGLFWCIQNDPIARDYGLGPLQDDANGINIASGDIPGAIGLCADEFINSRYGSGWPFWLYPRETRRMKAMYVMKESDIATGGTINKATSIAKWAYNWDIHSIQAFIPTNTATGKPWLDRFSFEGTLPISGTSTATYQIPVECMLPPIGSCTNLIVPVCAGFSHVAWSAQRLELPFGLCGEAAGELAAWLCDNSDKTAQQFDYATLSSRLTQYGSKI